MMRIFIDEEQARRYLELRKKNTNITWDDIINGGLNVCERAHADKLLDDYTYRKIGQPMTPFGLSCVINELICKCIENESKELKDAISSVLKKGGTE